MTRVFVVADTHNKLPQKIVDLAREADEIWHLGDVCAEIILDELRAIGPPVTIVRGNCDDNSEWPLVVELPTVRVPRVMGRVVRCDRAKDTAAARGAAFQKQYMLALKFVNPSSETQTILNQVCGTGIEPEAAVADERLFF